MATNDDSKPFDSLPELLDSYEALAILAEDRLGPDAPALVLLRVLNGQFRGFVDAMGKSGALS